MFIKHTFTLLLFLSILNQQSFGMPVDAGVLQLYPETIQKIKAAGEIASFEQLETLSKFLVADTTTLKADGELSIFTRSAYYPPQKDVDWKTQLRAAALLMDLPIKKTRTQSVEGELSSIDLVFASAMQNPEANPLLKNFLATFHRDLLGRIPYFEQFSYRIAKRAEMVMDVHEKMALEYRKTEEAEKKAKKEGLKSETPSYLAVRKLETIKTPYGMPLSYYDWVNSVLAYLPGEAVANTAEISNEVKQ